MLRSLRGKVRLKLNDGRVMEHPSKLEIPGFWRALKCGLLRSHWKRKVVLRIPDLRHSVSSGTIQGALNSQARLSKLRDVRVQVRADFLTLFFQRPPLGLSGSTAREAEVNTSPRKSLTSDLNAQLKIYFDKQSLCVTHTHSKGHFVTLTSSAKLINGSNPSTSRDIPVITQTIPPRSHRLAVQKLVMRRRCS